MKCAARRESTDYFLMDNKHDHIFLSRTLLQLFPDIFFHPLWIGFREKNLQKSSALGLELFRSARQLQSSGDIPSACQVLLICAALQKKSGDYLSALNNVQRAWSLAEQYELTQMGCLGGQCDQPLSPRRKTSGKTSGMVTKRVIARGQLGFGKYYQHHQKNHPGTNPGKE